MGVRALHVDQICISVPVITLHAAVALLANIYMLAAQFCTYFALKTVR